MRTVIQSNNRDIVNRWCGSPISPVTPSPMAISRPHRQRVTHDEPRRGLDLGMGFECRPRRADAEIAVGVDECEHARLFDHVLRRCR